MLERSGRLDAHMAVCIDLSKLWRRAASEGHIVSQCTFPDGHRVQWGVTLLDQQPVFYEEDGQTGKRSTSIEERLLGPGWSIVYHRFRPLRPGATRPLPGRQMDLPPDPMACPFGCQDPRKWLSLLGRAPLAQITCEYDAWHAYPNAAPFHPEGHFLWVPAIRNGTTAVLPHRRQRLTQEALADFVVLARTTSNALLFFNAPHGGASANHLHFQSVVHHDALAIELASRQVRGSHTLLEYPATALVFENSGSPEKLWPIVDRLQQREVPFNLIAVSGSFYLVPRDPEHEVVEEFPGAVLASMEIAGRVITGDRNIFNDFSADTLARALRKSTLAPAAILEMLSDLS
jgi:hypothetical protein